MKVYMLLDRSGSMASLWKEALGSINGYVDEMKRSDTVFLAAFDSVNPFDVIRDVKISKWTPITSDEVTPRGGTPLNDAAGKLLSKLFEDDPRKAVVVIMTDGEENSSQEYTTTAIKSKLDMAKEKGYEVVFLGANFSKVESLAANYGIARNRVMNVTAHNLQNTMRGLAGSTQSYATEEVAGATMDAYFTEDNKANAVK